MKQVSSLITLLLLATTAYSTGINETNTPTAKFTNVVSAKQYGWGSYGLTGKQSDAEREIRANLALLNENNIKELLKISTNEGSMYLLCALAKVDITSFRKESQKSKYQHQRISTYSGSSIRIVESELLLKNFEKFRCNPFDWK